ncbi:hypothetical protein VTK73DRAFT_1548 [Phialemonium thermophilum]|uniref:NADP-dependent oxidoreductase domain-containing protein n=1 Tax=Phialemonium thermophilum TaxID=223376 RepID=A0ABR3X9H1_9PEZI
MLGNKMKADPPATPVAYGTGTAWFKSADAGFNHAAVDAILMALSLGYRHIDGAQMYNTEAEIGHAIKESNIARSNIFLTTKTVDLEDVEAALEASLEKLNTSYVDLYLIHSPFAAKSREQLQAAWHGMEQCLRRGLARNIGLSNFAVVHIQTILQTAVVTPAVNQIELHPYLRQPGLLDFLRSQNIAVQAVATLTPLTKMAGCSVCQECKRLAAKYGVSESSVLLRWAIDQGALPVTTSRKRDRLQQYITDIPKFHLTSDEIQSINQAAGDKYFREFFAEEFRTLDAQNEH